jgi:hypothetical protein
VSKPAQNVFGSSSPEQGAVAVSTDGGATWQEQPQGFASGYDTERGLGLMDAILSSYPSITPEDAAAVAGNFMQESYAIPNIYEGENPSNAGTTNREDGGFGLAQWTGPRRQALMAMPSPETLDTQMQYFMQENAGPEATNWQQVLAAPDLNAKTETFMREWERPGVPALNKRLGFANDIYNLYQNRERMRQSLQTPITTMELQPVDIVRPNLDANLMLREPRIPMPTRIMSLPTSEPTNFNELFGIGQTVAIPYNRTPQYILDQEQRLMNR